MCNGSVVQGVEMVKQGQHVVMIVCCSVVQGVEMVKQGRQLEAIQHLNMALKIDPTHTEALVARGAL